MHFATDAELVFFKKNKALEKRNARIIQNPKKSSKAKKAIARRSTEMLDAPEPGPGEGPAKQNSANFNVVNRTTVDISSPKAKRILHGDHYAEGSVNTTRIAAQRQPGGEGGGGGEEGEGGGGGGGREGVISSACAHVLGSHVWALSACAAQHGERNRPETTAIGRC